MIRRPSVRLVVPLLAAGLVLAACGADEPAADATALAETTPPASAPATSAPVTVVTTTLAAPAEAACNELASISTEISSRFSESVGIEADAVLDEEQTEAVRELATSFAAVEIPDEGVAALRDAVVAAVEVVVARVDAGGPLTVDEATGFTGALGDLGSLCSVGAG